MGNNPTRKKCDNLAVSEESPRGVPPVKPPIANGKKVGIKSSTARGTLTDDSRIAIRESWKEIKEWCRNNNRTPGMCVFEKVLKLHPPLRTLFRMGPSQTLACGEENPLSPNLLHRHSFLFTNVLDLMVKNLEELDSQIAPALIIYGKRHYYKQNVGFNLEYLGVFIHAMVWTVYEVQGDRAGPETMEAWELLIRYMVEKLKHGYQLEAMNRSGKLLRVFRKPGAPEGKAYR